MVKVSKNKFRFTKQLTEQGIAGAQFYLGVQYEHGRGVTQDDTEAAKWYRKAAEQLINEVPNSSFQPGVS